MPGRRSAAAVLATVSVLAAAHAEASPTTIAVEVTVASASADAGEISGLLLVESGESDRSVRQAFSGPGRVEVPAPAATGVLVTPEVEGFWGAPVAGVAGGDALVIRLFPTGLVRGRLEVQRGTAAPESLRASFEAPLAVRALGVPTPRGSVDCPVADDHWTCTLPEGVLDLRLHAPGFASALLWEVPVQAGTEAAGGSVQLVPGAAVLGRVEGGDAEAEVVVEIRPDGAESLDAYSAERLGQLFRVVEPDRRGFFQFRDLAPGQYRVEATAAGRAAAVRAGVEVLEGRETDLGPPLVLQPPSRLELQVDPPVAPDEERWTVRLSSADGSSEDHVTRVDWTGFGLVAELAPGTWRYFVTSRGSTWAEGEVEVSGDLATLDVDVPLVPIEGIVRRGDEPARARIVFGGSREHPERIEVFADREGRFSGHLPRVGRWPAFVVVERDGAEQGLDPVEVSRAPGEEAAWIEIELFDTEIRGRVVDADGRPVTKGIVIATRTGSDEARRTNARPDREGRFRLRGVKPGTWALEATRGGDSGSVEVDLAEGDAEEVEIRLSGGRLVEGTVVSPRGPVAAARLYLIPEIARAYPLAAIKTGPLGEFRQRLPRDVSLVHVLVMAPGYAARILSLHLPADGEPVDDVSIAVGELGGTLRLELPGTGDVGGIELRRGPTRVYLTLLAPWAGYHGTRQDEVWELPAMEPGAYQLCSREACEAGTLGAGGTLDLRLTPPEEDAEGEAAAEGSTSVEGGGRGG